MSPCLIEQAITDRKCSIETYIRDLNPGLLPGSEFRQEGASLLNKFVGSASVQSAHSDMLQQMNFRKKALFLFFFGSGYILWLWNSKRVAKLLPQICRKSVVCNYFKFLQQLLETFVRRNQKKWNDYPNLQKG